jgi:hypothetical protein
MRFREARRHFFHAPRCASSEWKNRGPGARGISKNFFAEMLDKRFAFAIFGYVS